MEDRDVLTTLHVRRAIGGDRESVEWLVTRFSPLLLAQAAHRLTGSLKGAIDPEDLVQDVWVRTLPRLTGLTPQGGRITPVVVKFLGTTLLNRVNTLLQKRILNQKYEEPDASALPADVTAALPGLLRREREDAVRKAIESLPDDDRAIVVLRGIEQNAVEDIGLVLGMKPNTVSQKYRRALDRLRTALPGSVFEEFEVPVADG